MEGARYEWIQYYSLYKMLCFKLYSYKLYNLIFHLLKNMTSHGFHKRAVWKTNTGDMWILWNASRTITDLQGYSPDSQMKPYFIRWVLISGRVTCSQYLCTSAQHWTFIEQKNWIENSTFFLNVPHLDHIYHVDFVCCANQLANSLSHIISTMFSISFRYLRLFGFPIVWSSVILSVLLNIRDAIKPEQRYYTRLLHRSLASRSAFHFYW